MKHRFFHLLTLFLMACSVLSAADERLYELRIYVTAPGKLPDLMKRFRDHTCKLFEKHGMENIGYWVPVDAEQGSESTLIYFIAHKSRDAAKASWAGFVADPDWKAAAKASEVNGKILAQKPQSIFCKATDFSPELKLGAAQPERTFELRTYTCPDVAKRTALLARFRDHTCKLFEKHGMTNVLYTVPTDADAGAETKLIYVLAHASKEAGQASFAAFREDPVWVAAKTASETAAGGSLTVEPRAVGVQSIYMKPADFSPLR